MTVRFPPPVYENLRRAAFEHRRSMNEIIVEAVERILTSQEAIAPAGTPES
jgi:Arc-like DNA binding domain